VIDFFIKVVRRTYLSSIYYGFRLTAPGAYATAVFAVTFCIACINVYLIKEIPLSTRDWLVGAMMALLIIPGFCLFFFGWTLKIRDKRLEELLTSDHKSVETIVSMNRMGIRFIYFLNITGIAFLILTPIILIGMMLQKLGSN
jgi:hypothetical protein